MKREVTVYDSARNGKMTVFKDVEVNTLRDLKDLLDAEGIDYTNMKFNEGVTGTTLLRDDSIIPDNIPFKGEIIHNVFINMTMQDNKVSSGMDRKALYEQVKPYADEVKSIFGKHYTNVSTSDLVAFLADLTDRKESPCKPENPCEPKNLQDVTIEDAITILRDAIDREVNYRVSAALEEREAKKPKSSFSDEDIASFLRK